MLDGNEQIPFFIAMVRKKDSQQAILVPESLALKREVCEGKFQAVWNKGTRRGDFEFVRIARVFIFDTDDDPELKAVADAHEYRGPFEGTS